MFLQKNFTFLFIKISFLPSYAYFNIVCRYYCRLQRLYVFRRGGRAIDVSRKGVERDASSRKAMFHNFPGRATPRSSLAIGREKRNEDVEPRESLRRDPEHAGRINPRWMITHGGT